MSGSPDDEDEPERPPGASASAAASASAGAAAGASGSVSAGAQGTVLGGPGAAAPTMESVEVVEDERVAPHGQVHVWWFVQKADDYVKAGEWPGAVSERRDAGPGTVWERVIRFVVPRGTELMRVETRPRPPGPPRDPLSYLEEEQKGALTMTRRHYYVVTRGGRIRLNPERRRK